MKYSPENLEIYALQKKTEEFVSKVVNSEILLSSESMGKLGTKLSSIVEENHEFL